MSPECVSVVLTGPKTLVLSLKSKPKSLGPNEVLIRINSVGICGSDIHLWAHGGYANKTLDVNGCILGHEGSGTIVEIGSKVTSLKIGDQVAIEPDVPCMDCSYCKSGHFNLCPSVKEIPTSQEGMFQQYNVKPENYCHRIPDNLSLEDAAIAEPLACALHAVTRAKVSPGNNVLVTGSGAIGLLCMLAAKAFGAQTIVCTDVIKSKVDHAVSIGATAGYVIDKNRSIDDQVVDVRQLFNGSDPDVTLECSGFESAVCLALESTKRGGRVALIGLGSMKVNVPLSASALRQLDIVGSCKFGPNMFDLGLRLMASGKIPAWKVITHRFPIEQFDDAFKQMTNGGGGKVLIQCEKNLPN